MSLSSFGTFSSSATAVSKKPVPLTCRLGFAISWRPLSELSSLRPAGSGVGRVAQSRLIVDTNRIAA